MKNALLLFVVVITSGCALFKPQDKAIISIDLLAYKTSPEVARKWGLDGLPGTDLANSPLKTATPRMLNQKLSDTFIKGLKQQPGTKSLGAISYVILTGEDNAYRFVSEVPDPKQPKEPINFGSRLMVKAEYDKTHDLIHMQLNPQFLTISTTPGAIMSRYDLGTDIAVKNGSTVVLANMVTPDSTPVLFLLRAKKVGETDLSGLTEEVVTTAEDDEDMEIDEEEESFNPTTQMVETSVVFLQVPYKIISAWGLDGSPPDDAKSTPLKKAIPRILSSGEAKKLLLALKKASGTHVLSATSFVSKLNSEAIIRANDEVDIKQEDYLELGCRLSSKAVLSEQDPKVINLDLIPVVQLQESKDKITAITPQTLYSLPDGYTLFGTIVSNNSEKGILIFVTAKLLPEMIPALEPVEKAYLSSGK